MYGMFIWGRINKIKIQYFWIVKSRRHLLENKVGKTLTSFYTSNV